MTLRRFATAAAVLLLAAIAGLIIALSLVDPDAYRDRLLNYLASVTGRSVAIDGELDIELSLRPALVAEGVRIGNAAWGTRPDMITIEKLETRVGILPLITGSRVDVAAFTLVGADILLERNGDGVGNWALESRSAPAPSERSGPRVEVNALTVERTTFSFRKAPGAEPAKLNVETLTLTPAGDARLGISGAAAIGEQQLRVDGTIGLLAELAATGTLPFDLELAYDGYGARVAGMLRREAAGRLSLNIEGNTDSLSGLSARLEVNVNGERPKLSGELSCEAVDLGEDEDADDEDAPPRARLFSEEPLPLAALGAVDLDLRIAAGRLNTTTRVFTDVNAAISLDDRVLSAKPIEAGYAGGRLGAALELDAAAATPALVANVDVKGMELGSVDLLANLVDGAPASIDIALRGRGATPAAIAASSNGHLRVEIGPGTITSGKVALAGADLLMQSLSAMNPADSGNEATELECAVINFPLQDGVAENSKGIALQTSRFVVLGGGRVDLESEQLNLALKPKARQGLGISAASLASLVRLRGTLTAPKVGADAKGVAAAGARIGAAIFTGGLSVLAEGALKKASSGNLAVCDVARGTVSLESGGAEDTAAPARSSALDSARDAGGKAVRSGQSLFKKLFD